MLQPALQLLERCRHPKYSDARPPQAPFPLAPCARARLCRLETPCSVKQIETPSTGTPVRYRSAFLLPCTSPPSSDPKM